MDNQHGIKNLAIVLGLALIAAGGQPLVNYFSGDSSLKTVWPSFLAVFVGMCLVLIGFFWKPKADSGNILVQRLAKWGASPIPYTVIFLLVWVYFETLAVQRNIELATLRNDQYSITQALNRFVLPRQLNTEQINTIGAFLQNFPPVEFTFEVVQGDDEASSYMLDVKKALEKGGWHTKGINYVPNLPQEGLQFNLQQTQEHAHQSDLGHPGPGTLLQEALGIAGIQLDGGGGGGGVGITEDSMQIRVGHRRKDSYVLPCEPK
jgi:hypothetical protein